MGHIHDLRRSLRGPKTLWSCTLLITASLLHPCSTNAGPRNESGIQVKGITKITRDLRPELDTSDHLIANTSVIKWCQGSVPEGVDLVSAGINAENLKNGVSCYPGDFDGNGFLDFVLYSPPKCPSVSNCLPETLLILFFRGHSVIRTQVISNVALSPFQKNDGQRKKYPAYDSKAGLASSSDAGFACHVHFFNPKSGLFEEVPYAPPTEEEGKHMELTE
jgi:hypothetical protein